MNSNSWTVRDRIEVARFHLDRLGQHDRLNGADADGFHTAALMQRLSELDAPASIVRTVRLFADDPVVFALYGGSEPNGHGPGRAVVERFLRELDAGQPVSEASDPLSNGGAA
jgi:hypothetical protein